MKRLILVTIIVSTFIRVYPQDLSVTAAPDTSVVLLGDQLHFRVSALIPEGVEAHLKSLFDTLAGKIIILDTVRRETVKLSDGRTRITDNYLITSFDSGTYVIPPFYAEVKSGDSLRRYYSDYSSLKVMRPDVVLPDTTDVIFDIVPPRKAPVAFREILPWVVIIIVMAVVIWLLARYLPRNPLKRFMKPAPAPELPHVIALRELDKLNAEELWQKGEIKEYYSRLSDILRRYIDGRYGIMSPELTTDETVRMLQKAAVLSKGEMVIIKEVLSVSDMVKFAKYHPHPEVHERSYTESVKFVDLTREAEKVTEVTESGKGGNNA